VLDRRHRGTEFIERPARTVLNPPEATGMGFWSLNPYLGCEFGCSYCYARFAHRFGVERDEAAGTMPPATAARLRRLRRPWEAFEQAIFVKRRADFEVVLVRDLARVAARTARGSQAIAIGTATDPYQPAERRFALTRRALELMRTHRGFRISVVTKSPLVARDAALLRDLNSRHAVAVFLSLISLDPKVIRLLEPRTPLPRARLRAVRDLADAGVPVGIFCAPVLPGLTDGTAELRPLLAAAKRAGAGFVAAAALRLPPGAWDPLEHSLGRERPDLIGAYRERYGTGPYAPAAYREALERRFDALRRDLGLKASPFPDVALPASAQLSLW
jgi:DNA repair photolyase